MTPDLPLEAALAHPAAAAIVAAAAELDRLRRNWLWPEGLWTIAAEGFGSFPARRVAIDERAAGELRRRTMTGLYNSRPEWLTAVHDELDLAVGRAYGLEGSQSDDEALAMLLDINLVRSQPVFE